MSGLTCHSTNRFHLDHLHLVTDLWVCLCGGDVYGFDFDNRGVHGWCVSDAIDCDSKDVEKWVRLAGLLNSSCYITSEILNILLQPLNILADQLWGLPLGEIGVDSELSSVHDC